MIPYESALEKVRIFASGGVRDGDENKFDYEGFLSPLVIEKFGEYMHKHRFLGDGSVRDSDNWQKGFGKEAEHFKVCMSSLWRHFLDLWKLHRGLQARETIDDAICGILFNTMAYYHKLLEARNDSKTTKN